MALADWSVQGESRASLRVGVQLTILHYVWVKVE